MGRDKGKTLTTPFMWEDLFKSENTIERMADHGGYYSEVTDRAYVVESSIIGCEHGSHLTRIGILLDHGVYDRNGNAVLTEMDCVAGENVYSFGVCSSPAIFHRNPPIVTLHRGVPYANNVTVTGPKCLMVLAPKWQGGNAHTHIYNGNQYEKALVQNETLICTYGAAIITVKEVNNTRKSSEKIKVLDSKGVNMIANMERNKSQIEYDVSTGIILSIPTILPDVGYGHDINQRPINPIPDSLSAKEALELLIKDLDEFETAIATGINVSLTQDQFNALVSLRYNVGSLGVIEGLLEYLEKSSYERAKLKNLINSHYDAIIKKNPSKEKYKSGWYSRTEKFLDIFFDGNYGNMLIDAVNGKVIFN